ncbi:hypothetical protein H072_11412 [Dactylellina haptotyla CBS 200.50]|uniref:Rhodopsin domain-containing protein n=1 Tax=Dactylellina haptotyla (strain CBS 200.50) TaxID=1284197 RepID=S7ZWU7_DACHA|nr:hypothetical protein H072_11412 [Dactylellina haptotyla CBS 200.50]
MASPRDVTLANNIALYLGCAARHKFTNTKIMDCIIATAEMYDHNPNTTIQDIAEYYAAPVYEIDMFRLSWFDGSDALMREGMQHLRDIEPILPHPKFYPALIPLVVAFTVVGTLVMMARFYSRLSILGRIPFYDWLMLIGFVIAETMMGVIIADAYTARNGTSNYDQTWTDISNDCIFLNIRDVLYPVAALIIKSSLLLFYWRLSPDSKGMLRWVIIGTFTVSLGSAVPAAVVNLVYYGKVDWWNYILDPTLTAKTWLDYPLEFMITGALNILTDVIIWVIPIILIWGPMRKRGKPERIATLMLFVLGAVVVVTGALRIATFWELTKQGGTGPLAKIPISVWTIIEIQLAIICASVPALRALVVKYFPKLLGVRNSLIIGSVIRRRSRASRGADLDTFNDIDSKKRISSVHSGLPPAVKLHHIPSRDSRSTLDPIDEYV